MVNEIGEYSKRGDIIDFFPLNSHYPIRLEFFDNILEKIKYFITQFMDRENKIP